MASFRASVSTPRPAAEAFDYMADFSHTREWDPGVASAERVDLGEVGMGSEFRLMVGIGPAKSGLVYRIVEFDKPAAVTLVGENATLLSHDRIEIEQTESGSRIIYDARLTLKGPLRLADPLLQLGFSRAARRALRGLERVMNA